MCVGMHFNPRSPHGERPDKARARYKERLFQSTLPARGATPGARRIVSSRKISIHAPRTGSDTVREAFPEVYSEFQSTLPARGATLRDFCTRIHGCRFQSTLPARGATKTVRVDAWAVSDFNPRSPHGERLSHIVRQDCQFAFQSTLPARGATLGTFG